jgi:peptidoglycan hydrolase-like protein with peptidoglycan-binding domain
MKHHSIVRTSWLRPSLLAVAIFVGAARLVSAEEVSADSRVALVQEALKLKHFYYGDVDGNLDCATLGALRRFQIRNGLPDTGAMDDATVAALTGMCPSPKAATVNIAAQTENGVEIPRKVIGPTLKPEAANAPQERNLSANLDQAGRLTVPRASYSVQLPSWSAQHRAPVQDRVEVRRAIPVTSTGAMDGSESSAEVVTTVPAYFTGQDGHVYTYYRKIRTKAADGLSSPTSMDGSGGTGFSVSRELSDGAQIPGGSVANR